jgi:peptidylprolyl isomerase
VAATGCVAVLSFGVPGLGAASRPVNGAVARVGSASITKAAFRHWLTVANDATQASTGVAAPTLPLPPDYTACIAARRTQPSDATKSTSELKALCAGTYQSLVKQVMNYLIQSIWIQGEAVARGVTVTRAQVKASYEAQRKTSKPSLATTAELNSFLAKSGQTIKDLKWRTYLNLLANGINSKSRKAASHVSAAKITAYYQTHRAQFGTETLEAATPTIRATIAQKQEAKADAELQNDFNITWRGRTACRRGYMVSSCSKVLNATTQLPATDTGHIMLPPSRPQEHTYSAPSTTTAPTGSAPSITTPTTGPLSTEPTIPVPTGQPPRTLVVTDLIVGTGAVAADGDTITVNYVGALYSNGKVFDASWNRHETYTVPGPLGTAPVIKGWNEGIVGMRVGGRRELIIPPSLAYGAGGSPPAIPKNATLIFIVDLLAVTH